MTAAPAPNPAGPLQLGRALLAWAVLSAILLLQAWSNIAARQFPDPDDVMRLVQVRDLLEGQGWFDLHQYRVDPPAGTLMHWSRIVDLPLALIIGALTPLVGAAAAEQIALIAVPLLTLGAIVLVTARIAGRFLDREAATLACFCVGLSPLVMVQLQPMRIDHHGWQIFTVVLALAGLAERRPVRGAMLSGAALAIGLSISLEVLPLAAAFGGVFALRWVADRDDHAPLTAFLATLAAALALLFAATRGFGDLAEHCDAVAPGHLAFFAIVAAGTGATRLARPRTRIVTVGLLALTGAVALSIYLWAAPQCAAGPFADLDPLVREYWYDNVVEGQPAWRAVVTSWVPLVLQAALAIAALIYLWRRAEGDARRWWFECLCITAMATVAGLLVFRSLAFAGALSAVPLGWLAARLLSRVREAARIVPKLGSAMALLVVLVPGVPVSVANAMASRAEEAAAPVRSVAACSVPDAAQALNRLSTATMFAPMDVSSTLLEQTHHSVVATNHHRAEAAMRDVIMAFAGPPGQARELVAAHHADYVLLCPGLVEVRQYIDKVPDGLAARLAAGRAPEWLEPVALPGSGDVRLWRVTR